MEKEVLFRMSFMNHLDEDKLEAYVMGRLPDTDIDSLEDHLLLCEQCQRRTKELELEWKAKRLAMSRIREEEGVLAARPKRLWSGLSRFMLAKPAWALGAVAVAIAAGLLLVPASQDGPITYRAIELSAMRGSDGESIASQSNERLRLRLDLTELEKLPVYLVAVVDAGGNLVWETSQATQRQDKLQVDVARRLPPGTYWVRLLDPAPGRRLLREYPLPMK